jgi:hypothetical protein
MGCVSGNSLKHLLNRWIEVVIELDPHGRSCRLPFEAVPDLFDLDCIGYPDASRSNGDLGSRARFRGVRGNQHGRRIEIICAVLAIAQMRVHGSIPLTSDRAEQQ